MADLPHWLNTRQRWRSVWKKITARGNNSVCEIKIHIYLEGFHVSFNLKSLKNTLYLHKTSHTATSWFPANSNALLLFRRAPLPLAMRGRRALVDDLSLENSDSEEPPASPTPSSGFPGTPTPSSEHSLDPPPPYSVNTTEWCADRLT